MTRLVLLPGLDGTGELFAPFVEALGGFPTQIIAYPPDRAMSYPEHEAHARSRLPDDCDFVLLAESFSGPVGIAIAASPPPGLKGLILCASFAANPRPLFGSLRGLVGALPAVRIPPAVTAPWLYAGRATAALRSAHAAAMARVKPSTLRARVQAVLAVDYRADLDRIQVPILYLQATADRLIPSSAGREILRLRSNTVFVEIDAPHFLLQTEPGRAAAAVRRFIDERVLEG
jgi:pimeloyl-ACP methyl ester carboxylesterase